MKMTKKLAAVGLALLTAGTAYCQPESGDWEISVGGSGASDNEFDTGSFNVNGSFGYFVTPNVEVALRQGLGFTSSGERWRGNTRGAVDYHFLLGKWVPYIGANIGYIYGDDFDNTWAAAPEIGVKYYVYDKTFLFAQGEYQWFFDRARDIDNNFKEGQFAFTIGIGFNIR